MRGWLVAVALTGACSREGEGGPCNSDSDCQSGYVCFQTQCRTPQKKEQALNAQSGVGSAPPERPIAGGERVRVRTTQGEGMIFAACAPNERLIGGGCSGGRDCASESDCTYLRSFPANFTVEDTLGARWTCTGQGSLQAYALCQETVKSPASASDMPTAGSGSVGTH